MMERESRSYSKNVVVGVRHEELPMLSPPPPPPVADRYQQLLKQTPMMVIMFVSMALSCFVIFHSSIALPFSGDYRPSIAAGNQTTNSILPSTHIWVFHNERVFGDSDSQYNMLVDDIEHVFFCGSHLGIKKLKGLERLSTILKNAAMDNNTVIITSLNDAWAEPDSMFDLLRESFRIGNETERYLKHLVVVTVDQKAYARCLELHPHCYHLFINGSNFSEEAYFMTPDYLKIVWRKIDFLTKVLELGYSFVFTDADIMWFRDPFSHLDNDADLQVSCDRFNGNPDDLRNLPNTGFSYVKSNEKTIQFYKLWYESRLVHTGHDQDVFNKIKFDPVIKNAGLRIRFLDTAYFGGFCEPSRDLNKVCTMHANCCVGLENKVHDLGIMLGDWQKYKEWRVNQTMEEYKGYWTVPQVCRGSLNRPRATKKKAGQRRKS